MTPPSSKTRPALTRDPLAPAAAPKPDRLLRFASVRPRTGLLRAVVWRLERLGAFPRHRSISAHPVAWLESDIAEWIRLTAPAAPGPDRVRFARRRRSRASGGVHVVV
jgi:predicted DNA-binding transcriptional regulator AlpA